MPFSSHSPPSIDGRIFLSRRHGEHGEGFRADLIIQNKVILELKSIERLNPAHKKQLLTYLKLSGLKVGYLLNFGEALMKDGITRIINGHPPPALPNGRAI